MRLRRRRQGHQRRRYGSTSKRSGISRPQPRQWDKTRRQPPLSEEHTRSHGPDATLYNTPSEGHRSSTTLRQLSLSPPVEQRTVGRLGRQFTRSPSTDGTRDTDRLTSAVEIAQKVPVSEQAEYRPAASSPGPMLPPKIETQQVGRNWQKGGKRRCTPRSYQERRTICSSRIAPAFPTGKGC